MNDSASQSPTDTSSSRWIGPLSPYPGLRPFDFSEHPIFFGRERHCDQILKRLVSSNFVSVIGPSGCGKSSLLKAGVMAQLRAGRFYSAGASWEMALMRPQNTPAWNLAAVLDGMHDPASGSDRVRRIMRLQQELLFDPKAAFGELRERTGFKREANVLLVVDQFEELFKSANNRSEVQRDEVQSFIELLLQIHDGKIDRTYCILTMRSDHLGDCSAYPRLADAVNNTFYLTPNLTETELRRAIELPALQFEGTFESDLVDRIYQDMQQEAEDQLPLMQHALMLMWNAAKTKSLEDSAPVHLTHDLYQKYGPVADTLMKHGDSLMHRFKRLPGSSEPIDWCVVEHVFRQLTERSPGASAQDVRRPTEFAKLAAIIGRAAEADKGELRHAINQFRGSEALFLQPFVTDQPAIEDDTRIDLVHECLIRKWPTLSDWVQRETEAAKDLKELDKAASEAKLIHGERVVAQRTLQADVFKRSGGERAISLPGGALARRAAELAWREANTFTSLVSSGGTKLLTVVRECSKSPDRRRTLLGQVSGAPRRLWQVARGNLKRRLGISDVWSSYRSRYLKPNEAGRFITWRARWGDIQRMPNAEWARNYGIGPASYKEAITYLDRSRRHNRLMFGVAAVACAGVIALGMRLKFDRDIEANKRLVAESETVAQRSKSAADMANVNLKAEIVNNLSVHKQQLAANISQASSASQNVDEERLTAENFRDIHNKLLAPRENLKGDPEIKKWINLQRHVIEAGLDTALSRQKLSAPERLQGVVGPVDSFSMGGSNGSLVVVASSKVRFFDNNYRPIGAALASPPIDPKDLDIWSDETGQVYWLGVSSDRADKRTKRDGKLYITRAGATPVVHDLAGTLTIDDYAISNDYSRIVLVGQAADAGARPIRLIDPKQPADAKAFDLVLPQSNNATIIWTSLGGPDNNLLAIAFKVRNKATPEAKDADLLRVTIWDLAETGMGSITPKHDFYTPIFNFETFRDMHIAPDGSALAFVIMPTVNVYMLDERQPRELSMDKRYRPNNTTYDLLNKGDLLNLGFLKSSEIALVTSSGWVSLWPYLVSNKTLPVAPRLEKPTHAASDADGNLYAISANGSIQHMSFSNLFGRPQLLPDAQLPTAPSRISIFAVDKHGGRLIVGRDDGRIELHVLQKTDDRGSVAAQRSLWTSDNENGARKKITAAETTTRLADHSYLAVVLDAEGSVFAASESGSTGHAPNFVKLAMTFEKMNRLELSADGTKLAVLGDEGRFAILHRTQGSSAAAWRPLNVKPPDDQTVCSLAFSPVATKVAAGTADGNIHVADIANGKITEWRPVGALSGSAETVAFSSYGDFILAGEMARGPDGNILDSTRPCSAEARLHQTAAILHSENGKWRAFQDVNYRQPGRMTFAAASNHPDGNTFMMTRWAADSTFITMLDAEPLGFRYGELNLNNAARGVMNFKFSDLTNRFDDKSPSASMDKSDGKSPSAVPTARESNQTVGREGAAMTCRDDLCWLVLPHGLKDLLVISEFARNPKP